MSARPMSRVRWSICVLALVLLALSWGYFFVNSSREYQSIELQANRYTSSLALGLEEHVRSLLQMLDIVLLDLAKHVYQEHIEEQHQAFSGWFDWIPELDALMLIDLETSRVVAGYSRDGIPEDLEFMPAIALRQSYSSLQIDNRLYRQPGGKDLLTVSRQISGADYKLQLVALVRIDQVLGFYDNFQLGPEGSMAVLHEQGELLARMPIIEQLIGCSFADGPLFSKQLKVSSVGLTRLSLTTDDVNRLVAYRKLQNYPLVVTVGTSLDWLFTDWKARAMNVLYIQLIVSVAIILTVILLTRTLMKMEQAENQLSEREEHFRSLADSTVDAVISVDAEERIHFWSSGAELIFACSREDAIGVPITCFLQFESAGQPLTLRRLADAWMSWPQRRTFEIQGQRKTGDRFPTELSVSAGTVAGQPIHTLIVRDVTERKQLEERISRMANHDNLTQLPNRRLLMDRLTVAIAQARRGSSTFALLFLDLDEFKPVNDTHGHEVGDQLLRQVAERLLAAVRESDTVARVGGDEFALLLNDVQDEDSVSKACQHILEVLGHEFQLQEVRAKISCSIGVMFINGQNLSGGQLIGLADQAMYRAKNSGKNRFEFAYADK